MTRVNASIFSGAMLLLSLIGLPSAAFGDAVATSAHWMAPPEAAKRPNPVAADTASLARGKKLFQAHCASCHGAQGQGDGPAGRALKPGPADLTAMAGRHSDGDFAWKIANGRGPMPAWNGRLSEKNIWDLVNFIQSLARPKESSRPPAGHPR